MRLPNESPKTIAAPFVRSPNMNRQPVSCRPEAFYLFADQLEQLDTTAGLINAAVAVSLHALRDVDLRSVHEDLNQYAERVLARTRSRQTQALLAHVHFELFEAAGFRGNQQDYYDPHNSYLPSVLASRRGLPITLSLVYKAVAERVGLHVDGINSPGHFLVQVRDDTGEMIVDPFFGGQVLSREEAFNRLEQLTGRSLPHDDRFLPVATHREWLSRILANLQNIFAQTNQRRELVAMTELQELLG